MNCLKENAGSLDGKKIVLGVCGGIAVYKAVELLRLLTKAGAEVFVVMTENARRFVTPLTFQTLSRRPVHSDLFDLIREQDIGHISLAERADLFVIAPATANLIGKAACGIADDLLSTTLMATRAPVLFVPAMNVNMWENPILQENLRKLAGLGRRILEPDTGALACGTEGQGKFPDPQRIFAEIEGLLHDRDLLGETVLVSAGPTVEKIDPARFIGNFSSGKMGFALARIARLRGARTILVAGPTSLPAPAGVEFVPVVSAEEMRQAVLGRLAEVSVVIMAAAVADFRVAEPFSRKLKKEETEGLTLRLEKTLDILAEIGRNKGGRLVIGFAAESENLLENARRKLAAKNLDLVVANDITRPEAGFGADTNIVTLLSADGDCETLPCLPKEQVAERILDRVAAERRR
ncbi:MAG: bifunctional phosphopantothenoylcysteine decarboxylase/phosphopantothenate--cysteine ligase CoaBC [Deltaproteobacteria bacterium]|nr:bifunctional phosphopantothenoylcysteine decarboxylase/phosphopantothenate--cysteine ligase CoaBC [Deltaproteobacteria bacterium]